MTLRTALAGLLICLVPASTWAQQVATDPASTHVFPAGGRRGTTVELRIGGECLPPRTRLHLYGAGVTGPDRLGERAVGHFAASPRRKPREIHANYPKEWQAAFSISEDALPGAVYWRLSCARGGTGARPFLVGDLPEFIEAEPNSVAEQAHEITLPVTVNGQIAGEHDLDFYSFKLEAGEVAHAEVMAARLGSALDPVITLTNEQGAPVATDEIRLGGDPVVALKAPKSGVYRLTVSNVSFQGGPSHVYRITLRKGPYVTAALPLGEPAAAPRDFELVGLAGAEGPVTFREALTRPGVSPGDCSCQPTTFATNPVTLSPADWEGRSEVEPNNDLSTANAGSAALMFAGRFDSLDDADCYRFAGTDQRVSIDCQVTPRGAPLLPVVEVLDAGGVRLAQALASDGDGASCRLEFAPPAGAEWTVRVRDQARSATLLAGYRLSVRPAAPDFVLRVAGDSLNLLPEGRVEVPVSVDRRGGFDGPVELTVAGLPEGVQAASVTVPAGAASGTLAITAAADVRSTSAKVTIIGRATLPAGDVFRTAAAPHLGRDAGGVSFGPATLDHVQLTVQSKPLFRLYCNEAYQYAHRGTVHKYLMEVERFGYDGPITLQIADRQNKDLDGVEVREMVIPEGESQVMLPLYLPESMHINVQAHSNVYAQGYVDFRDAAGEEQSTLVVSTMRCMIRTLPTLVRLRSVERAGFRTPGETVECRLELDRTSSFGGAMRVSLVSPAPAAGSRRATADFAAGEAATVVPLRIPDSLSAGASQRLRWRAVGYTEEGTEVISEAETVLEVR